MLRYRPRLLHLHTYLMLRYRPRLLHLHTYLMLRYRWVGVEWGGLITFNGTSTHTWCYATDLVSCTCTHTWCYATVPTSSLALAHIPDATQTVPVPIWAVWQPRLCERTCSESAAPEKNRKVRFFCCLPVAKSKSIKKTRHPETAFFYSWRSQKRANTSEKWWKNKTQWN